MLSSKKATISYLLSEDGRKQSLLQGGNGCKVQKLQVDATERLVMLAEVSDDGSITLNVGFCTSYNGKEDKITIKYYLKKYSDGLFYREYESKIICFDRVMTVNELLDWEENRINTIKKEEQECKKSIEENNVPIELEIAEKKRIKEIEEEAKRQRELKRQTEIQAEKIKKEEEEKKKQKLWAEERNKWIEEFGSQYLKDAIELGYNINKKYIEERAEKEFVDFQIDFDDNAGWGSMMNPSPDALNEVKELVNKGYNAEIVWLTNPVDEEDEEYFEECEALVIRKYLDKYDLVKVI